MDPLAPLLISLLVAVLGVAVWAERHRPRDQEPTMPRRRIDIDKDGTPLAEEIKAWASERAQRWRERNPGTLDAGEIAELREDVADLAAALASAAADQQIDLTEVLVILDQAAELRDTWREAMQD